MIRIIRYGSAVWQGGMEDGKGSIPRLRAAR